MPELTPPAWQNEDASNDSSTVALLFEQFGDVLIPLEAVRARYFRNLGPDRFRRAIREGQIDLPVTTLDSSQKAQGFICIYHLAVLIERQAHDSVRQLSPRQWSYYRRAIPTTEHEKPPSLVG
ncbi:pyocin activator PrtN family protein [Salinicola sp. CPA57]|uniref:pyocin activator PrtN family protein n=1 Tax=Salinicola sp. CPA57 TaxID=1949080 RepID=UPI000DA1EAD9|nr:pyocin activator PrtN family protein [Salinicola sp. CPA57]